MDAELKPCPFCGGKAVIYSHGSAMWKRVECSVCGAAGESCQWSVEEAVEMEPPHRAANAPLTLDELRQMDGEPVWIECELWEEGKWFIIATIDYDHLWMYGKTSVCMDMELYSKAWLAYRRRPEEVQI